MNVSNKNNEEEVILYDNESNNDNKNSEIKEKLEKLDCKLSNNEWKLIL
jgi:hypothetical protein